MTEAQLKAIEERVNQATPGPWCMQMDSDYNEWRDQHYEFVGGIRVGDKLLICEDYLDRHDALFIAEAREAVPALIQALCSARGDAEIAEKFHDVAVAERNLERLKVDRLEAEVKRLRGACSATEGEVQQILGKALGYPWFKDDGVNFPGATERDGVCVGEHVAASLASEAAERLKVLEGLLGELLDLKELKDREGKIAEYHLRQPLLWTMVRVALRRT